MKLFVKVRGDWITIACGDGENTIKWVGEEALKKYYKLSRSVVEKEEEILNIQKTKNSALLDPDDSINTLLDDGDYLTVVTSSSKPELPLDVDPERFLPRESLPSKVDPPNHFLTLDGNSLSPEDLHALGEWRFNIKLSDSAWKKVEVARALVEEIITENRVVYGVTTGFGKFSTTVIEKDKMKELQESLIRSHSAGVGKPLNIMVTRMLLALRINVLAKGFSGITKETLQKFISMFNASCLPWIPEKGSVGASGDLAPLAHLALGLMGEGKMWSPITGWTDARNALSAASINPVDLKPKEGLCLINGTQLMTSIGADALVHSARLCKQADVVAAMTLEVLKGTTRAFDANVHAARPHKGQIESARRIRALLHNDLYRSEISESHRFCSKVQDAYTVRCCPQVHGIVNDTVEFVRGIITTEMNSATDNPLVFSDVGMIVSAGNFHGEYPAKALDYLGIGIHELANMSERRTERLVNPAYSDLPAFLTKNGGLNSGFMMAHVTAAALVSENKVLTHPSSVDSLTTSGGQEDHVSMGAYSARKCSTIIENVEWVLAIELLCATQAIEFLRPLKTTAPLEAVYRLVRSIVPAWEKDRFMAPDIEAATNLLKNGQVWDAVEPYLQEYESQQVIELWTASPTTTSLKRVRGTVPKAAKPSPLSSGPPPPKQARPSPLAKQ